MGDTASATMIQVQGLEKRYGNIHAVRGVSFEIAKGEIVGFLGPNGAGKSTCLKTMTCFLPPTSGAVRIAGMDVQDHPKEVRRKFGYLPENAPLYPDMLTFDYLRFVGQLRGLGGKMLEERLEIVARKVGISHVLGQSVGTLSKGYRQRVCLAQALIHDPEILILDEPTVGLDPNQVVEIRNLIKELGKDRTVILSTHILHEVLVTCDRIIIIHKGRIVADGTPQALLESLTSNPPVVLRLAAAHQDLPAMQKTITAQSWVVRADTRPAGARDELEWEILGNESGDLRKQVLELVAANSWNLLELRREMLDLEGLFRKLTQE